MRLIDITFVTTAVSAAIGVGLQLASLTASADSGVPVVSARTVSTLMVSTPATAATCATLPVPAMAFATESKYESERASRDVLDASTSDKRRGILGDSQAGVHTMQALVAAEPGSSPMAYSCAAAYILQWARADALTVPQSDDANRTLARLTADLSVVALRLDSAGYLDATNRETVNAWLVELATTVRRYFDNDAGSMTRQNNHRYWAALALAGVGRQTNNDDDVAWAVASYAVGVCQVTTDGFLPLELSRRTQARNYHLYAYEALQAVQQLLPDETASVAIECREGLQRLARTVMRADSGSLFQTLTGVEQAEVPLRPDLVSQLVPTAT